MNGREHILRLIAEDSICAEIGVWKGDFAARILRREPKRLHLIDPWLYLPEFGDRVYGERGDNDQKRMDAVYDAVVQRFSCDPQVVIHRKTSEDAAMDFSRDYFDFVYIDGNHSYEFVKRDIENYLTRVKVGAYIVGDDYEFDRCPLGGPRRAVNEVLENGQVELISIERNQFVLVRLA